ncbi:hypothetical protein [Paenibacillus tepidiphilus]|uniref:hypothetical protein n=1 Tax=Paenibacillus tepidiphilus TaxID=2608683 RepID=UPI0013A531C4|nr:hypothetical protein [Paenibacillus tepidiphilus]
MLNSQEIALKMIRDRDIKDRQDVGMILAEIQESAVTDDAYEFIGYLRLVAQQRTLLP